MFEVFFVVVLTIVIIGLIDESLIIIPIAVCFFYFWGFKNIHKPIESCPEEYESFYNKMVDMAGFDCVDSFFVKGLDTWFIKNKEAEKTILFLHGGSGNVSMRHDLISFLHNYASVLIFDYRSYGRSFSSFYYSENDLVDDTKNIWDHAINKMGIKPESIVIMGEEIGCSIATKFVGVLAENFMTLPSAIVLNSPWRKSSYEYDTEENIKLIPDTVKIMIAHSRENKKNSFINAASLLDVCKGDKIFVEVGGTHETFSITREYINCLIKLL